MKINDPQWYPSYLNPSFDELLELAASKWDTCRILINPLNDDFIIGSGYGNTHASIVERYRIHLGRKRAPQTDTFIMYHEGGVVLFNMEDMANGHLKTRWTEACVMFSDTHCEILKDLIRESGLAL